MSRPRSTQTETVKDSRRDIERDLTRNVGDGG
jgi:hypothetical protein